MTTIKLPVRTERTWSVVTPGTDIVDVDGNHVPSDTIVAALNANPKEEADVRLSEENDALIAKLGAMRKALEELVAAEDRAMSQTLIGIKRKLALVRAAMNNARKALASTPATDSGQWRTIESAPKDGTVILGFFPDAGEHSQECSQFFTCFYIKFADGDSGWKNNIEAPDFLDVEFTHWQPLPFPPKTDSKEGEER